MNAERCLFQIIFTLSENGENGQHEQHKWRAENAGEANKQSEERTVQRSANELLACLVSKLVGSAKGRLCTSLGTENVFQMGSERDHRWNS